MIGLKIILAFLFTSSFGQGAEEYLPVVLWHGMGGNADGTSGIITKTIEKELPGVYVKSLRIGETNEEDTVNGFFLNVNTQVQEACKTIRSDPKLQRGFNAMGFSQGGQFLRALVQRCPEARVRTLITLGAQHQGVYGLPHCPENSIVCDFVRRGVTWVVYQSYVQNKLVQAQYWKDPRNIKSYLKYNTFLADINNEGLVKNSTYKEKLAALDRFVMVRFNKDSMVHPTESSWFGFYTPGQATEIQPLNQTTLYKEDWLGLQALARKGGLHFLELDSDHLRFNIEWFKSAIINDFLKRRN